MSIIATRELCVKLLSVKSECEACLEACRFEAINFVNSIFRIDPSLCVSCGSCAGACPSGAIGVDKEEFFDGLYFADSLSVDELFVAALSQNVALLKSGDLEYEKAEELANAANELLGAFGFDKKIGVIPKEDLKKEEPLDSSKRALFKLFTKEGIREKRDSLRSDEEFWAKEESGFDYALLRSKKIPKKREAFLSLVQTLTLVDKEKEIPLSFATNKHIDDECDNCALCYNLCPTGALEIGGMKNVILFSPHLCIKCRLCEEVCEPKAISSLPTFRAADFIERPKKILKKFKAKLCVSCGAVFSGEGEECPRCEAESDDARSLLGL